MRPPHITATDKIASLLSMVLQRLRKEIAVAMRGFSAHRVTKVAFPAVGTGNLKYSTDDVADVMMDTINSFFMTSRQTDIKKVYIVIYYQDEQSLQVHFVFTYIHVVCRWIPII